MFFTKGNIFTVVHKTIAKCLNKSTVFQIPYYVVLNVICNFFHFADLFPNNDLI